jgi:ABC-type transport system substrate-binding protein
MLVEDVATIPLVWEKDVRGINKYLKGLAPTPWDSLTWNIQDWYFAQP